MNCDSGSGGFVNGRDQRRQFVGFCFEGREAPRWQQSGFFNKFHPKKRFIDFLQHTTNCIDPIWFTARATGSAVTRGYRGCRPQELIANNFAFCTAGQRVRHVDHAERKVFGSGLELFAIHSASLCSSRVGLKRKS